MWRAIENGMQSTFDGGRTWTHQVFQNGVLVDSGGGSMRKRR
jgi:hypothetical protein